MEGNNVGIIGTLLLVTCVAGWVGLQMEITSKKEELSDARAAADIAKSGVEEKQAALVLARQKFQALQDLFDSSESLKSRLTALEGERESLQKEYVDAVINVRSKAVGTSMPELRLPNDKALQAVTIQKVTDSEITLAHSGGVTKMLPSDLPEELRQKFRHGMFPMMFATTTSLTVQKTNSTPGPAPAPNTAPQPPTTPSATTGNAAHIKIDIASLEAKVITLEQNRVLWMQRAASLRQEASSARSSGKPSYTFTTQANQADQTATSIDTQLSQVHAQIAVLKKKLADAMAMPR